tara:strand:+ start:1474 stop:2514 length:1041 start_codon:yes stop_codon:yes gene_type:complete
MAVLAPAAALVVTKKSAFMVPAMAANPLGVALENTNHLYRHFCPPLVDALPMLASGLSRATSWTFGVMPSADGLRYEFQHRFLPSFASATPLAVQVWTNTGTDPAVGWASIYGPTTTAASVSGVPQTHTHTAVVGASARMMRVQYTAPAGVYQPWHILVRPDANPAAVPFVAPFGITSSGFRVWDSALLSATGGPVNTEMVDRCRRNSIAVLTDRRQNVMALLQEDGVSGTAKHVAPSTSLAATDWVLVGKARAFIPWQSGYTLQLRVLASVSGGATTANRVQVSVSGGASAPLFAASGQLISGTLTLQGDSQAGNSEDFEIRVRRGDAATTTRLHSVMAFWQPGS